MALKIGMVGRSELMVTEAYTAAACKSGAAPVFSTPSLIMLMENAAFEAIESEMEPGNTTVGTFLNVKHTAATPIGMKVWAEAELIEVDRNALTFTVRAFDECGSIGEGTHGRFIINEAKFLAKVEGKRH